MMTSTPTGDVRRGLAAVIGAFLIWGVMPLYLRLLQSVPVLQIMAHRVVWCCAFVLAWLTVRGERGGVRAALQNRAARRRLCGSALLICLNWLIYVWAVNNDHVIEASLGYFINPLVNVLFGALLLSERLNRAQWTAVSFAAVGVAYLFLTTGSSLWISPALAITFSGYGLIRKTVAVDAITGLGAETLLLVPLSVIYLVFCQTQGTGVIGHVDALVGLWLAIGGLVSAVSLTMFAYGARRIAYSTVGVCQYVAPTLQLLLGVFLFHEPFTAKRAVGFGLIWIGLLIYAGEGLIRAERKRRASLRAEDCPT